MLKVPAAATDFSGTVARSTLRLSKVEVRVIAGGGFGPVCCIVTTEVEKKLSP